MSHICASNYDLNSLSICYHCDYDIVKWKENKKRTCVIVNTCGSSWVTHADSWGLVIPQEYFVIPHEGFMILLVSYQILTEQYKQCDLVTIIFVNLSNICHVKFFLPTWISECTQVLTVPFTPTSFFKGNLLHVLITAYTTPQDK
jgi:hypothetical protein